MTNKLITQYFPRGGGLAWAQIDPSTQQFKLHPGIYVIEFSQEGPYVKLVRERFNVPAKVYGKGHDVVDRIYNDWQKNPGKSMGALLTGLAGAGKSMACEVLCNRAIDAGFPVIMIDKVVAPAVIDNLMTTLQGCVAYYDEIGKVYSDDANYTVNDLLTIFSSNGHGHTLNLATGNKDEEISEYFNNRPGRFRYYIKYPGITVDAALDAAESYGITNHQILSELKNYVKGLPITYDILFTVLGIAKDCDSLSEVNQALEYINVPEFGCSLIHITHIMYKGVNILDPEHSVAFLGTKKAAWYGYRSDDMSIERWVMDGEGDSNYLQLDFSELKDIGVGESGSMVMEFCGEQVEVRAVGLAAKTEYRWFVGKDIPYYVSGEPYQAPADITDLV